jgi:predicted nucleic acid-binding protein
LKAQKLRLLTPKEVYREAVEKGLQEGFSDALIIKECVDQDWIRLCRLYENGAALCLKIVEHAFEFHLGMAQAIVLTRNLGALLLMDESSGRLFAEAWSLKVKGTLYVIVRALREELLDKTKSKEIVFSLVKKGF